MTLNPKKQIENPKLLNPLVLAYMGDVVLELMVRETLVSQTNMPVNRLHQMTVERVNAHAQSVSVEKLMGILTDEEIEIFKRGRNANGNHVPKNANAQEYRRATGLETLFGYLYLSGRAHRIEELFSLIWEE